MGKVESGRNVGGKSAGARARARFWGQKFRSRQVNCFSCFSIHLPVFCSYFDCFAFFHSCFFTGKPQANRKEERKNLRNLFNEGKERVVGSVEVLLKNKLYIWGIYKVYITIIKGIYPPWLDISSYKLNKIRKNRKSCKINVFFGFVSRVLYLFKIYLKLTEKTNNYMKI